MFSSQKVKDLQPKVLDAIKELLHSAKEHQKSPNDIIVYLSNGHFDSRLTKIKGFNGLIVGPGELGLDYDLSREFIYDYLNSGDESLLSNSGKIDRNRLIRYTLNLELMIYTHFWENDYALRQLKQLANLVESKPYDWYLDVPERDRYGFISKSIIQVFLDANLKAGQILKATYHSQLRNAFAHGKYSLRSNGSIYLTNYHGESYEMEYITYSEWEERFSEYLSLFSRIASHTN